MCGLCGLRWGESDAGGTGELLCVGWDVWVRVGYGEMGGVGVGWRANGQGVPKARSRVSEGWVRRWCEWREGLCERVQVGGGGGSVVWRWEGVSDDGEEGVWVMHMRKTQKNMMMLDEMRECRMRGAWGEKWDEKMPPAEGRRPTKAARRTCTCM